MNNRTSDMVTSTFIKHVPSRRALALSVREQTAALSINGASGVTSGGGASTSALYQLGYLRLLRTHQYRLYGASSEERMVATNVENGRAFCGAIGMASI